MKRTVLEMLKVASQEYKDYNYVSDKTDNGWESLTFSQVDAVSSYLAIGLIKEGLHPTDKVGIMSEGRAAWIVSEFAILKARAVAVPLSVKLQADEIAFRLVHSESKYLVVSKNCIQKAIAISDKLRAAGVKIVYLDMPDNDVEEYRMLLPQFFFYDDLVKFGRNHFSEYSNLLEERMQQVSEDDLVVISYTSGTMGNPKGVMLTHLNYWSNSHDAVQYFRLENFLRLFVVLPIDHAFAHTVGIYCGVLCGLSLYFVDSRGGLRNQLKNIVPNIKDVQPEFMLSVPALMSNFMRKIQDSVAKKGKVVDWLFKHGLKSGILYYGDGLHKPCLMRRIFRYPIYSLAEKVVFSKVRKVFGDEFRFFICGGAMLEIKQQQFFNCIGAPVMQGYGLSEASPVVSVNQRHRHKFGSSGGVLSGIDCKIIDHEGKELPPNSKGLVTVRGLSTMKGYFKNPKATEEAFQNGYLNTGDMGYLDEDGFLYVTGREKALLISSDGEKYSPEEIEDAIVNCSEYIVQCVLYNDHSKYTTALITLDRDRLKKYVEEHDDTSPEKLLDMIKKSFLAFESDYAYKDMFPKQWIPSVFYIVGEPFSEANGLVNSTMKIIRFKVLSQYKDVLVRMATPEGKVENEQDNLKTLEGFLGK
ncbi:MAG: AMP-binding protein [Bacteroidales bacterium]|nr:AMP-binding protein [Bacteroidales bacterium]